MKSILDQMQTTLQENQRLTGSLQADLQSKEKQIMQMSRDKAEADSEAHAKLLTARDILSKTQSESEEICRRLKSDLDSITRQKKDQEDYFKDKIATMETQVKEFLR